jgi:hypothetical protein
VASFESIVRRPGLVLLAYLAVAAAFAPGLPRLEIDNSPERFFVHDSEALERLRDLELRFGRDGAVRLVVPGDEVWSPDGLARLATLEARAEDPRRVGGGVYGAAGLYRQHRWHLDGWPPVDPEGFRELVISDPLDRNAGWVSRDGGYATVLVGLFKMPRERREATLRALEELLPDGGFAVGVPVVDRALGRALLNMFRRSLPLLLAVTTILLLGAFCGWAALFPLALAAVSQTVLFGAMGYAGQRMDIVTVVLAPLVFVIAVATGVHVLAYHQRVAAAAATARDAVVETYRAKAWPVFWTGMTTCAGFGSLAVSPVPPVRWLGLWAAFGIAYLTLAALTFFPALLAVAGAGPRARPAGRVVASLGRLGGRLAAFATRRRRTVFLVFGAAAVAAAAGVPRLGVETNALTYLAREHPVRSRIAALEDAGVGSVSASLVVARPDGAPLDDPEAVRRLSRVASALRSDPRVLGAVSAGDLLAAVARHDPEILSPDAGSAEAMAAARRRIASTPELARLLGYLETGDGSLTRVLLTTGMRSHRELEPLYRRAELLAARELPDAEAWVTGQYPLVLAAQRSLLRTVVLSLALTLLVITAMLGAILRSGALTWRALVPNLWPVLLVLGTMGWSGVPVDSATVMIAAVVLGLAVDDTLHTLGRFRHVLGRAGSDPSRAAVVTLGETAAGHVTTSVVLTLGFVACAFSPLVPVARFGALAAVGIAGALAADLLLVPALLASAPAPDPRG